MPTVYADSTVSAGACVNPGDAWGAPDGNFTDNTGATSWTATWGLGNPTGDLSTATDAQSLTIRAGIHASGGVSPSITQIRVLDGTTQLAVWTTGWTMTVPPTTGQDVGPLTWTAPASVDETNLRVEITTSGSGGGPNQRSVVVDAITLVYTLAPSATNVNAGNAPVAATGYDATVASTAVAVAGVATVAATAGGAGGSALASAGAAAATSTGYQPTISTITETTVDAGVASVAVAGQDAAITATSLAGVAAATSTAYGTTVSTSAGATAAAVTVVGLDASVDAVGVEVPSTFAYAQSAYVRVGR